MKVESTIEWLKDTLTKGPKEITLQTKGLPQITQDENPNEANPSPRIFKDLEERDGWMESDSKFREEIYSKAVRAGKRTYFFDVKSTRRDEFYLTITESKKRFEPDGNFYFEKHKIFLYQEDFEKFKDGLQEVISYIDQNQGDSYMDQDPGACRTLFASPEKRRKSSEKIAI